jgi:Mn2+/Fe2+ NRAMP family transporter
MMIFTSMSARIGLATQRSVLQTIREKWGKAAAVGTGVGVFFVTASFQAGNSIGVGISLGELLHTPAYPWIITCNLVALGLLFFRSFYKLLEKIMMLLIGLMLFAFVSTLLLSRAPITSIVKGVVPAVPAGSVGLIVAFIASCFSVVGAFYQSYLVQERRRLSPGLKQSSRSSYAGMIMLGFLSVTVLICASVVLHPAGIKVQTATDMARALQPLFGHYASVLFLCGLFGASFSALVGNSSVGGTVLSDALGRGSSLRSGTVRILIALIMITGAAIALIFGRLPLELIIFAQTVTIFVVPFIGLALYLIAGDRGIMGEQANGSWTKGVAATGLVILFILAVTGAWELFFK